MSQDMVWKPIETAIKDSKARLVWCPENQCTYCVTWNGAGAEGWIIFGGGWRSSIQNPTHWMPLPSPPSTDVSQTTEREATT